VIAHVGQAFLPAETGCGFTDPADKYRDYYLQKSTWIARDYALLL
jgi:hypothetical protein